jgi:hypothetical protein
MQRSITPSPWSSKRSQSFALDVFARRISEQSLGFCAILCELDELYIAVTAGSRESREMVTPVRQRQRERKPEDDTHWAERIVGAALRIISNDSGRLLEFFVMGDEAATR